MLNFNDINIERIHLAITLACSYHDGQYRISGKNEKKLPYISHPMKVATKVCNLAVQNLESFKTLKVSIEDMIIAAISHDMIEDTKCKAEEIEAIFGVNVVNLVLELTSDSNEIKRLGKAEYLTQKINSMSIEAAIIKLCDRIDNISDLKSKSNSFSDKYYRETMKIFGGLTDRITNHDICSQLIVEIGQILVEYREHRESQGIIL